MGYLEGQGFGEGRVLLWSRPEQQLFTGKSPAVQAEVIPGTSFPTHCRRLQVCFNICSNYIPKQGG